MAEAFGPPATFAAAAFGITTFTTANISAAAAAATTAAVIAAAAAALVLTVAFVRLVRLAVKQLFRSDLGAFPMPCDRHKLSRIDWVVEDGQRCGLKFGFCGVVCAPVHTSVEAMAFNFMGTPRPESLRLVSTK